MKIKYSQRGFPCLTHPVYLRENEKEDERIISMSSAIGDYEDAYDKAGSSYLWFGSNHHLNREEVAKVVEVLQQWLKTGSFEE